MVDNLECEFWLFEQLPDGRIVEIQRGSNSLWDADLRNERYDLDVEKWSREWHWNARQAACISFSRDPAKIDEAYADDDTCGISANSDGYEQHLALENAIEHLTVKITDAQRLGLLYDRFFCPGQYFSWADRNGVLYPEAIWRAVKNFEREARSRADEAKSPLEGETQQTPALNSKARGPQAKQDNSLKKILLALMVRCLVGYDPRTDAKVDAAILKLQSQDLGKLAGTLVATLEELERKPTMKGGKLPVTERTIQDNLSEAIRLLK